MSRLAVLQPAGICVQSSQAKPEQAPLRTFVVTRPCTGISMRPGTGGLMCCFGMVGGPAAGGGRPGQKSPFASAERWQASVPLGSCGSPECAFVKL